MREIGGIRVWWLEISGTGVPACQRCAGVPARATANKSWNFVIGESFLTGGKTRSPILLLGGRGREELDASERDLVVAAMKSFDGQRYQLAAYVVMDDHVHALVTPFAGYELEAILHSWKSFTAPQMQRDYPWVWPLDR